MSEIDVPDSHQNPCRPFEERARYRAFRQGWEARFKQMPRPACPYALSQAGRALAWLDGWTAAQKQEQDSAAVLQRVPVGAPA